MRDALPFSPGQRVRFLGYPPNSHDDVDEQIGEVFVVERLEPRPRWSGPRSQWPRSHVLTREDLDAGHEQVDGGWSWDPPEWFVHARRTSSTGKVWVMQYESSAWELANA